VTLTLGLDFGPPGGRRVERLIWVDAVEKL